MQALKRTAIVTGASQGIGEAITRRFLEQGYNVVANSRHITASGTFSPSSQLVLIDGDIGKPQTAEALVTAALEHFGRIDILVNNAGLLIAKPFTEYTETDFYTLVSTIQAGFFFTTQKVIAHMLSQHSGNIINISTSLTDQPIAGVPCTLQGLAKGGMDAAARSLAIEYATQGIRVNTIAAGIIDTPMHKPEQHAFLGTLQPMGRMGKTTEIVDAVMYLNDADFVTGEILHVDGGTHAGKW